MGAKERRAIRSLDKLRQCVAEQHPEVRYLEVQIDHGVCSRVAYSDDGHRPISDIAVDPAAATSVVERAWRNGAGARAFPELAPRDHVSLSIDIDTPVWALAVDWVIDRLESGLPVDDDELWDALRLTISGLGFEVFEFSCRKRDDPSGAGEAIWVPTKVRTRDGWTGWESIRELVPTESIGAGIEKTLNAIARDAAKRSLLGPNVSDEILLVLL